MLRYILKRIILFLPTILIISVITFGLSKMTPGDPVEKCLDMGEAFNAVEYANMANFLHMDKPVFYGTIQSIAYPDTLYRVIKPEERHVREKMISQYGNWPVISAYFDALRDFKVVLGNVPDSLENVALAKVEISKYLSLLNAAHKQGDIAMACADIDRQITTTAETTALLSAPFLKIKNNYQNIKETATRWKLFVPGLNFYGLDNQYHIWLCNFLGLNDKLGFSSKFPFIAWEPDMGTSCPTSSRMEPVIDRLIPALKITLLLSLLSLFITFLIAIPLGVYAAGRKGSRFDRWSSLTLFMFYSVPSFWLATIMIVFFTTSEYGEWMDIFPPIGLSKPSQLILPVFCLSINNFAFLSRQMRSSMINVIQEDFIRTARAKGLSNRLVAWRHAFKNALFPIVTIFAGVFPAAIAGSVILEVIFNIPGMGRLVYFAIRDLDWSVVYAVLMLSAFLTMFGMLFSDLIYAKLDPRVAFDKTT